MKFFDSTTKYTIRDEINRICGTTDAVYALTDKLARVDMALDEYWKLASDSAPKLGFDDTGNTSLPVETQNIVSGTNNYKISSFSNKVLQILRIAILDSNGNEYDLIKEQFDNIQDFYETYTTDSDSQGKPSYWTKMGDFIYLRSCPDYNYTNGLRAYVSRELSKFTPVTFTTTSGSNQINATAHGLSNGDTIVMLTNNTLPNGYSTDIVYYVINATTDTFQVATAGNGSVVTISDDGTGTHKFIKLSKEPGIPVIHHAYLAKKSSLPFVRDKKLSNLGSLLREIGSTDPRSPFYGGDELAIAEYWQNMDREFRAIIKTHQRNFK